MISQIILEEGFDPCVFSRFSKYWFIRWCSREAAALRLRAYTDAAEKWAKITDHNSRISGRFGFKEDSKILKKGIFSPVLCIFKILFLDVFNKRNYCKRRRIGFDYSITGRSETKLWGVPVEIQSLWEGTDQSTWFLSFINLGGIFSLLFLILPALSSKIYLEIFCICFKGYFRRIFNFRNFSV